MADPAAAPSPLSRVARQRRDFIERHSEGCKPKVLEIGAFDNPTFRRDMGDEVQYLDYFSAEELRAMHGANPSRRMDAIVAVDHVVKSKDFASAIDDRFDLVVANHLIEHVPDPIAWLAQIQALLGERGRLFMAVPDRRYTFDYFRPETLATHLVRAHHEGLTRPDKWQLAEHFYYHQKVDLAELWAGRPPEAFVPRFDFGRALAMAEQKAGEYCDAHCWVFTPRSFRQAMADLHAAGLVRLQVDALEGPVHGSNEFWVSLRA